jgi:hypothetical protein
MIVIEEIVANEEPIETEIMIANLQEVDLKDALIAGKKDTLLKNALNVRLLNYSARQPREFNRERGGYKSGPRDYRGDDRRDR